MTVGDRRRAALAGHTGDVAGARALLNDPHAAGPVRSTALSALARLGAAALDDVTTALADHEPDVRRRACQVAIAMVGADLVPILADADPGVVEVAAWALGERGATAAGTLSIARLSAVAVDHVDPLCREAAVAALGAIGDDGGLAAILTATRDRPAIRRRAVIALAPFSGPEVDAALHLALSDRDWQVRQAAEDLRDA